MSNQVNQLNASRTGRVWGNFGVGPYEAVKGITETRGDFVSDSTLEKYGLTFNPTGYLRRISKVQHQERKRFRRN